MDENPYSNRELDEKFKAVHDSFKGVFDKLDDNKSEIMLNINETKAEVKEVKTQTVYTNGKVRKIIIALVLVGGILIGQAFTNATEIISLVAHIL